MRLFLFCIFFKRNATNRIFDFLLKKNKLMSILNSILKIFVGDKSKHV